MSSRKDDYLEHIRSPLWAAVKHASTAASGGLCAFCGALAKQTHHVRYPKKFAADGPHNTVPVCARCHEVAHGGMTMKIVKIDEWRTFPSPTGASLEYALVDGAPYATADYWRNALSYPLESEFSIHLTYACTKQEARGKVARVKAESGELLYRWGVVERALRGTWSKFTNGKLRHIVLNDQGTRTDVWAPWMERYEELIDWGTGLQEQALVATARALPVAPQLSVGGHLAAALGLLNETVEHHSQTLTVHESEIEGLKQRITRDPSEHLTTVAFCAEIPRDPSELPIPSYRQNLAELLGAYCAKAGMSPGPKVITRLSGNSMLREINTWRRCDLQAALRAIDQRAHRVA